METKFFLNIYIYDNTTGKIWTEYFDTWSKFYKRYNKLKHSKKLWCLTHSKLD